MLSSGSGSPADIYPRAAVIGAGLMGRRLAGILAGRGVHVRLHDTRADQLSAAVVEANELAATGVSPVEVRMADDLDEAIDGTDLVLEAIIEDLAVKQDLFARVSSRLPAATLATNTSVIPVTDIAAHVEDGGRVVGTHFWNPPDLIPVVEVVKGQRTSPEVVDTMCGFLSGLGKLPVIVQRDGAGFIGNRIQHALWREAIALVEEGVADAATVDLVVRNTIGLRLAEMGPLENADYVGLDLTSAIHQAVLPELSTATSPQRALTDLIKAGRLGAKSGSGFLPWPPGAEDRAKARLGAHVRQQLAEAEPELSPGAHTRPEGNQPR